MTSDDYRALAVYAQRIGGDLGVNTYSRKPVIHLLRKGTASVVPDIAVCYRVFVEADRAFDPETPACRRCLKIAERAAREAR